MAEDEKANTTYGSKTKEVASKGFAAVKTHGGKALKIGFAVFMIVIVAIFGFMGFSHYSQTKSSEIRVESGREGAVEISKRFDVLGKSKPITTLRQLFAGTYDPNSMWTAERVKSDYSDKEELEFIIRDIKSAKSFFYPDEELQVNGKIDVSGGIKEGTPVELSFADSCPVKALKDCEGKKLRGEDWTCYISGSEQENIFQIRRAYNRIFYCVHPETYLDENSVYDPTLGWKYRTGAVATKQIYVASREVLERVQDPVKYFEIDEESLKTWYLGEEQVNVGLGLDRDSDFIIAYDGITPKPIRCLVGISIQNNGAGIINSIDKLTLTLPSDSNIKIVETDPGQYYDFENPEELGEDGFELIQYSLRTKVRKKVSSDDPIGPNEYKTYYLSLWVDESYLEDSSYQSFNIKATVDYTYRNTEKTTVTIRTRD